MKKEAQLWRWVCSPAQDFRCRAASGTQRSQPVTLATATSVEPLRGRKLSCSESKRGEGAHFTIVCALCVHGCVWYASMCAPVPTHGFSRWMLRIFLRNLDLLRWGRISQIHNSHLVLLASLLWNPISTFWSRSYRWATTPSWHFVGAWGSEFWSSHFYLSGPNLKFLCLFVCGFHSFEGKKMS